MISQLEIVRQMESGLRWAVLCVCLVAAGLVVSISSPTVRAAPARSYPTDPTADIAWSASSTTVAGIQSAFNNARTQENAQLGLSISMLTMPSQSEWDGKSDTDKALWLINRDRIDRGIPPLHSAETNVTSVAQTYAQYLFDHDAFSHYADGRDPWERLIANPAINACHDFLNVAENLYVSVTSGSSIALPVEKAVYNWMYDDSSSSWGHRHASMWYPYNDNSGTSGKEGFIGIGRAHGGPYQGPFSQPWNYAEIIVMNVFDPCSTWSYPTTAPAITSANHVFFIMGTAGTFTVTSTGTPTPTLSLAGTLPTGLVFSASTGVIAGTPGAGTAGTTSVTLTASNGTLPNATQTLGITVIDPATLTNHAFLPLIRK